VTAVKEDLFDRAPALGPQGAINFLLYGPAGSGKTTAAAGVAPGGEIVWINFEGSGAMAFARKRAEELGTTIREVRMRAGEDPRKRLEDAFWYASTNGSDAFVIDTAGKLRAQLAQAMSAGEEVTLPEWGAVGRAMTEIILELRDARFTTVVVAHEEIVQNDELIVQPLIGGRTTAEWCGEVDVLAYCRARTTEDGTQYLGQLVEAHGRRAKDRSGALGVYRPLDLAEWQNEFCEALALDVSDVPFLTDNEREDEE
jgi:hypothetical protein